jgi:hypothetical protein
MVTTEDVHAMCMLHIFFKHRCMLEKEAREYCAHVVGCGNGVEPVLSALCPLCPVHAEPDISRKKSATNRAHMLIAISLDGHLVDCSIADTHVQTRHTRTCCRRSGII